MGKFKKFKKLLMVNKSNKFSYYKYIKANTEEISDFEYNCDTFLVSCAHNMTTSAINDIFWNAKQLSSYNEINGFKYLVNRHIFYYFSNDNNKNRFSFYKSNL